MNRPETASVWYLCQERAVTKRSPILGYNHNIQHRGLVFHVQTEDSGVQSPHIFTHVFHGGVILGTRKLVYAADASDEAVKSLMQAQHKAVLKDLKRGKFDGKIDQILAGAEGLLPARGGGEAPVAEPAAAPAVDTTLSDGKPQLEILGETPSRPIPIVEIDAEEPDAAPDAPQYSLDTGDTERLGDTAVLHDRARSGGSSPPVRGGAYTHSRRRRESESIPHAVERFPSDKIAAARPQAPPAESVSGSIDGASRPNAAPSRPATSPIPPRTASSSGLAASRGGAPASRPRTASTPPPSRPPTSPPLPPRTASTSSSASIPTQRNNTPPPGVSRTASSSASASVPTLRSNTPPAGVSRTASSSASASIPTQRTNTSSQSTPIPTQRTNTSSQSTPSPRAPHVPASATTSSRDIPVSDRTPRPEGKRRQPTRPPPSGVVVSRPAVIIGAPPRVVGSAPASAASPPTSPPSDPRRGVARRAREEPSRTSLFGKDLISEKSLDEVILAYLSEDSSEE